MRYFINHRSVGDQPPTSVGLRRLGSRHQTSKLLFSPIATTLWEAFYQWRV